MLRPRLTIERPQGFSLAEVLISVALVGVISVFTLPVILQSNADKSRFQTVGKEVVMMLEAAYRTHQMNGLLTSSTKAADLTQYLNYIRKDTSSTLDYYPNQGSFACAANMPCYFLANGAAITHINNTNFGGTNTTNAIFFRVDPDGVYSNTTNGPGKMMAIWIYYDGHIRTYANLDPNTYYHNGTTLLGPANPVPSADPSWFTWDF